MKTTTNTDFLLDLNDPKGLRNYLTINGRLYEGESIEHLEVAGEGNMNVVLRVVTGVRSFILKQSLPYVRKYPTVSAPRHRILMEYEFYSLVRSNELIRNATPEIFWIDKEACVLCMQDFGSSQDFTDIYRKGREIAATEMQEVASVISALHRQFKFNSEESVLPNTEMRLLNHAHIFDLPFNSSNGFNLDGIVSGLQSATRNFRNDEPLKRVAKELGEVYLSNAGSRLLHGDYYPGSWLRTPNGFRMIDPEFCFKGQAEFELAVVVAHLKMAQQSESIIKDLLGHYEFDSEFDCELFSKFTGIEVMRRILGLAQLPLELDMNERLTLLDEAYEQIMHR